MSEYGFVKQSEHRAAREHTCDVCGDKINKGECYQKIVGVGYDGFYAMKAHIRICPRDAKPTMKVEDFCDAYQDANW